MTNFMFIILVIIVLVVIALVVNKPFRQQLGVKFRGRTEEVMRQDASTPEGARDYFNAAIREKEDFYNKAAQTLSEVAGKLASAEKDLYQTNKEIMKLNNQINSCLDENNDEDAMAYARKKAIAEEKIEKKRKRKEEKGEEEREGRNKAGRQREKEERRR